MGEQRAILVTGASSGIGNATSKRLAAAGFAVFAGVRKEHDAREMQRHHENLRPVTLDVTDADSIAHALDVVRSSGLPLHGLLNNAGIALGGPLEYLPLDELRRQFEVNTFAPIALAQAALPLLRAARGRIVSVGSIASRFGAPFVGPYCASKAALASLMDSLRAEIAAFGVPVVLFEFAAVKTPIWEKGRSLSAELRGRLPQRALDDYAPFVGALGRQIDHEERNGLDPQSVAAAIAAAFTARTPRPRYVIGRQAKVQAAVALLPHATRDKLVRKVLGIP
ncbi:MAG TPA: SDR family NAD(P)-dependent oxidoreductase [Verrucomicrobiae bacterium]|nr:SDR family NAD(P)-dependent oxidoreductase [Verrucomicrobiae bacterium]